MNLSTSKVCPDCGSTHLALLRSLDRKVCGDCGKHIPWYVKPGEQPLLQPCVRRASAEAA